ncbi:aldehyde dehydrogenase family protein [Curtobacterium sp. Leaf261]|uniref:aldehyde dehydrogenase family protein n=1 Tax=Curtobacterium sp. Leaf261 TaxID=1736311 RepID=UPI0006F3945B|nr:aldehyde dehydrogenase family protein [Curtobacterium sp. Leaf261]KQO59802.1 aldehyde dehydrogenase [Curtobacterium sp. Leaf261]
MSGITGVSADPVVVPERSVFIGGDWVSPDGERPLDVVDPATEQVIGTVLDASPGLAQRALRDAREAWAGWTALAPSARADLLDRLAGELEAHRDELATLSSREIGMPLRESGAVQVDLPVKVLRTTADIARGFAWDTRDASGSSIVRESVGVVLAITPWNFPLHQIVAKLAPALAAGCTVVLKPAELTPLGALFLAELGRRAGLPAGVFDVVTGTGATTGEALLQDETWDVVSFTGSLGVGRHVGAVAGGRIKRATLELGGKSPAVVLDDADLATAVRTTVKNCFTNAGQKCNAPTRLIVPRAALDEAVAVAVTAAEAYVLGDPLDPATTMGPMVSAGQRAKVLGFVDAARAAGATIATGGTAVDGTGWFMHPTIVTDVGEQDDIVRQEVFGPVLVVQGHDGPDDAVRMANDTPYGLSSEVWSGSDARARDLARRIRAGQVRVNGVRTPALPVSPFGGYGESGLGREMGPFAIEEYLEVKAVLGDPVPDDGTFDEIDPLA